MKKLLLVSILCFPHKARPITAPQAACSAVMVGGIVSAAYSLYQWHNLEIKKNAITTQLHNSRLSKAKRDALLQSLQSIHDQCARYEIIGMGSVLLTLAGYSLFPASSKPAQSSHANLQKPYVRPAPISLIDSVKKLYQIANKYECPICLNEYEADNKIWCQWHGGCNHALCKTCNQQIVNNKKMLQECPQCQAPY